MRLFIAINPSSQMIVYLKTLQDAIRAIAISTSYVKEFHLTLKFLGKVSGADKVMQVLDRVRFKPFEFSLAGIGFFPNKVKPRVLWVGIEPKRDVLELHSQIDKCLVEAGFPKDPRFHPHITLGRIKHAEKHALALADTVVKPISTKVESFNLIKSELRADGPAYTVLKEYKL